MSQEKNTRLDEFIRLYEEDFAITRSNITEKSISAPQNKARWLKRQIEEERNLKRLRTLRSEYIGSNVSKIKSLSPSSIRDNKQSDMEETIGKLDVQISYCEETVKFLTHVNSELLRSFGYDVKNIIDAIKLNEA